jgi:hypothetical protein
MAKTPPLPSLDLSEAFVHVINEHRWLAASACTWNLVGPKAKTRIKIDAHDLLPNVDVTALDSVLLHARALIDFYTKNGGGATDITLKKFNRAIDPGIARHLVDFKRPIEVHVLHLTNWRDISYRLGYSTDGSTLRRDWYRETSKLVTLLYRALRSASNKTGDWQAPFKELYEASWNRYRDKLSMWPKHLGEKVAISLHLDSLNL